mgnify:CR=1 FL=1
MKIQWKCVICEESFNSSNLLYKHIRTTHNKTAKEYYDENLKKPNEGKCLNCGNQTKLHNNTIGYLRFCCLKCSTEYKTKNKKIKENAGKYKCKICDKLVNGLGTHIIQFHHITCKEYYDKYLRKPGEGICPVCGKETTFRGIFKGGYLTHCSWSCAQRDKNVANKKKETSKKLHGVENYRNPDKARKTFNANHTVEEQEEYFKKIIEKRDSIDEKTKEKWKAQAKATRYEKNGEGNWVTEETIKQTKKTKKDRYGDENWNNREQAIETCLEKWGQTYPPHWSYSYNGIGFDSSWEVAYYIWLKDHNIEFEYHPSIKKTKLYYYWKNKKYSYYVDFIVNGEYVELKINIYMICY